MLNELAEGFGSITKGNTNFSGQVKDSISHIEETIEWMKLKKSEVKLNM